MFRFKRDYTRLLHNGAFCFVELNEPSYALAPFPLHEARVEIADYYTKKYLIQLVAISGIDQLFSCVADIQKQHGDHRAGFIVDFGNESHIVGIIYERINKNEKIFVIDSLGDVSHYYKSSNSDETIYEYFKHLNVSYYACDMKLQADFVSCATIAMTLLKDILKDSSMDFSIAENLRNIVKYDTSPDGSSADETSESESESESDNEKQDSYYLFDLPEQWLKSAQISIEFIANTNDDAPMKNKRNETFAGFRSRFVKEMSRTWTKCTRDDNKVANDYIKTDVINVNTYSKEKMYRHYKIITSGSLMPKSDDSNPELVSLLTTPPSYVYFTNPTLFFKMHGNEKRNAANDDHNEDRKRLKTGL